MPWTEKDAQSANGVHGAEGDRVNILNQTREEYLPLAEKEAASGAKAVEPIKFQPVMSPGNYEAEFAVKGEDVIFHFWPHGYHDAEKNGTVLPRFKRGFQNFLVSAMAKAFDPRRLQIEEDKDMGAIFVKAIGFAHNEFYRKLAIEACELLHKSFES